MCNRWNINGDNYYLGLIDSYLNYQEWNMNSSLRDTGVSNLIDHLEHPIFDRKCFESDILEII